MEVASDARGPIRVLLADDQAMFRRRLALIVASHYGIEVVGEIPNDEWALRLSHETRPEVIVMGLQMPFERAKEALRRVHSVSPSPKVIIITVFENPRHLRELMELGANAYLVQKVSAEHLISTIHAAVFDSCGEHAVGMPREIWERAQEGSGDVPGAREMEILQLSADGLSNHQVASRLHVAASTIKRHLANTYEKLEVHSRSETIRKALAERWITIQKMTKQEEDYARSHIYTPRPGKHVR
jgi:DNA-binding NarL/FixJ family response regulator